MPSTQLAHDNTQPRSATKWFVNAPFDLFLIFGLPPAVWILVTMGERALSVALLFKLIVITATGHYFATFARVYGDLRLIERFKFRVTVVPLLLVITSIGAFATGHAAPVMLLAVAWGLYHWIGQAYGVARFYDAKIGSFRPMTAALDKALVIVWFVGAIVLNARTGLVSLVIDSGVRLPGAEFFAALRQVVLAAVVLVTAAYVANIIATLVRRERVSVVKQFSHVSALGFYWFVYAYSPSFFVSYVLYELFHDLQYFSILWVSGRARVERGDVTMWMRRLFRPGLASAILFVFLMFALGSVELSGRLLLGGTGIGSLFAGAFVAVALSHYYFDSFIWQRKARELVETAATVGRTSSLLPDGLQHAMLLGLFFVPLGLLVFRTPTAFSPREKAEMLVAAAPGSFESHLRYARALEAEGELQLAAASFENSIARYDGYPDAHWEFASVLERLGRDSDAAQQYEIALKKRPSLAER